LILPKTAPPEELEQAAKAKITHVLKNK